MVPLASQFSGISSRPGPAAYAPAQSGQLGFARGQHQAATQTYRQYATNPGLLPIYKQGALDSMQQWGNQVRRLQGQQRPAQAPKPAGQPAPAAAQPSPLAAPPAQAPAPQQQTTASFEPAQTPQQPPANPLLGALQGSPWSQGQTQTTAGALSRAIGGIGSAGPGVGNQEAFLKRLREMMTTGRV